MKKILPFLLASLCAFEASAMETKALFDPDMYKDNCQMQDRWARMILEAVNLKSAKRILDVGSGDGHITFDMAKAYPHATLVGLDLSPEMVNFAKYEYRKQKNLTFLVADAHKLPSLEPFDAITSFSTIHRLADPHLALAEIFNALAPGGKFVAAFPASGSPIMSRAIAAVDSKPEWKGYFPTPDRKNYNITDQVFEKWLSEAGFLVIKTKTRWEDEVFASRENFRDLLRATFSQRNHLPPEKELEFFEEVVDEYLKNSPLDENGKVHFYFNRIEVIAVKAIVALQIPAKL